MHQPWASLLIHGIKRIEGRSWRPPITGRLWIHAASKVPEPETITAMETFYREIYALDGITDIKFPEHYPVSRLLGCVEIAGCLKGEELDKWEEVPKSVRCEALTDFCWLCENPKKLIVPFEMRGYQRVYNLENKIFEAAVRGLTPSKGPLPVKFPLPYPQNPPLSPNSSKASKVEKTKTVAAAVAGARAAAAQFLRKDESRSLVKELQHETTKKEVPSSERNLISVGMVDAGNCRPGPRILTPNGSAKLFSDALRGVLLKQ
ncbi:activating signal cointegrator 1 [Phalaenopsis equestris]|uniref:activating signal cointegrator 1 n=1 Tax=Phalaenopsis equestris TaxID=78828 RepID=UPI0009E1FE9E|nr:activating signal cointegrator 1 [Phalaenopsis equestris]